MKKVERVLEIIRRLEEAYPDVHCTLDYSNPLELLVATMLSAQCTDERVNQLTKDLFGKYRTPWDYANADLAELEEDVRPTGFYRNKARNIKRACQVLIEEFDGEVPQRMEDLVKLPGVARKTANVVLGTAFGVADGFVVDTHVKRLARRLGLTQQTNPGKIEIELMEIVPRGRWIKMAHQMIIHGRMICQARSPKCAECVLVDLCPSAAP
ncbi:MAG: endonuclease III [Anaerolineae bacterium]